MTLTCEAMIGVMLNLCRNAHAGAGSHNTGP